MLRDGAVFDDEHLPREIVGPNSQMNEVTDALAPVEDGARVGSVRVSVEPAGAARPSPQR